MSQKKRNARKNANYHYSPGRKVSEDPGALQETQKNKKMNPATRNLLFLTLIFLAVAQLLLSNKIIDEVTATWLSMVALVLILAAVVMQVRYNAGPKHDLNKSKGPRL